MATKKVTWRKAGAGCGVVVAGIFLIGTTGCTTRRVVREEQLGAPNQGMSKLKGDDMPPGMGAPMPSGWRGFKAY